MKLESYRLARRPAIFKTQLACHVNLVMRPDWTSSVQLVFWSFGVSKPAKVVTTMTTMGLASQFTLSRLNHSYRNVFSVAVSAYDLATTDLSDWLFIWSRPTVTSRQPESQQLQTKILRPSIQTKWFYQITCNCGHVKIISHAWVLPLA